MKCGSMTCRNCNGTCDGGQILEIFQIQFSKRNKTQKAKAHAYTHIHTNTHKYTHTMNKNVQIELEGIEGLIGKFNFSMVS